MKVTVLPEYCVDHQLECIILGLYNQMMTQHMFLLKIELEFSFVIE